MYRSHHIGNKEAFQKFRSNVFASS